MVMASWGTPSRLSTPSWTRPSTERSTVRA